MKESRREDVEELGVWTGRDRGRGSGRWKGSGGFEERGSEENEALIHLGDTCEASMASGMLLERSLTARYQRRYEQSNTSLPNPTPP